MTDLLALLGQFGSACTRTRAGAAGAGCADGTREGFTDIGLFPKIAACEGDTNGVDDCL